VTKPPVDPDWRHLLELNGQLERMQRQLDEIRERVSEERPNSPQRPAETDEVGSQRPGHPRGP
jgi:hypothetical protein